MMYGVLASSMGDWPVIKQVADLLGEIMNLIYNFLDTNFGIQNIALCIIIFTVIVYTLMIPLTIKQQKFSKLSAVVTPEVQKVQKKYAGRTDRASAMRQQEEVQLVYEKYGTSPTGGCLPLLIQMPLLFALYPVIQNIPRYVDGVRNIYLPIVNQIMATDGYQKIMETIGSASPVSMNPENYDYTSVDTLVNVLYKFQDATWNTLVDKLPSLEGIVNTTIETLSSVNNFLGINIAESPGSMFMNSFGSFDILGMIVAIIIPVLSAGTQYLNVKLQPSANANANPDDPMASSMKSMTYTMPIISLIFCFSLPTGLGIYWVISAVVRSIQQIGINKYLSKISVEDMIKKNQEKAAKKREKKGAKADELKRMATSNTRNMDKNAVKKSSVSEKDKEDKIQRASAHVQTAKEGTLAYKAAMVNRYNNQNSSGNKKNIEEKKNSQDDGSNESVNKNEESKK